MRKNRAVIFTDLYGQKFVIWKKSIVGNDFWVIGLRDEFIKNDAHIYKFLSRSSAVLYFFIRHMWKETAHIRSKEFYDFYKYCRQDQKYTEHSLIVWNIVKLSRLNLDMYF